MKTKSLIQSIVALGLLAGSAFAQTTTYPGTFCVRDGVNSNANLSYNWGVRAENKHVLKKVVNCPIIKNNDSDRPYSVTINVYDGSRDESVSCKVQSWSSSGLGRLEKGHLPSGIGYKGARTFTILNPPGMKNGTFNILCRLPMNSYISSYKINQR